MYVIFRLIWIWWRAKKAPKQAATDLIVSELVTFPNDLDLNFHVNNGRYLTLMDLGRYDLIVKTGLFAPMRQAGWFPVLASAQIRFRRSLGAFQRFRLTTQIIYWDEKWFYIEHRIERRGELYARGLVKGLFKGPGGANVSTATLLAASGKTLPASPEMPEIVRAARLSEEGFR